MTPHETLFLEQTNDIRIRDVSTSQLIQLRIVDFPGSYNFRSASASVTAEAVFGCVGCLVYVIDAQDDSDQFSEAIDYFITLAKLAFRINPRIHFNVLIHRVDGEAYATDDHKSDAQSDIAKELTQELAEAKLNIRVNFHLTSIYDHTIFEALSKILQTMIVQLPMLEQLLDGLIASCQAEKAFLFDVVSKIYVATDSNPVDMSTYELCSDMIDVVIDVSCIYGVKQPQIARGQSQSSSNADAVAYDTDSASVIRLSSDFVLYLREVNKFLALVTLMRTSSYEAAGLIEYNFQIFKSAIDRVIQVRINTNK